MKSHQINIIRRAVLLFVLHYSLLQICNSQCWVYVDSGTNYNLQSICFIDSSIGIAVGGRYITGQAILLRTTDGGVTWNQMNSPVNRTVLSVSFLDKNIGWATTSVQSLFTSDGGLSWNVQPFPANYIFIFPGYHPTIATVDSNTAVLVLNGSMALHDTSFVLRTTDRGNTWTEIFRTLTQLNAVSFATASDGYIVGDGIYRTTDGGLSWSNTHPAGYRIFDDSTGSYLLTGVFALNANNAIAVGSNSNNRLWRTNDGGNSWVLQDSLLPPNFNYASMGDSLNGIVVSSDGQSIITHDGGSNWITMKKPSVVNLYSGISFAGRNTVLAVASTGTMMRAVDTCSQAVTLISPANEDPYPSLTPTSPGGFAVNLQWNYPPFAAVASSRIQVGTDSTFSTGLLLDSTMIQGNPPNNTLACSNIIPKKTQYWRVKDNFSDLTSTAWSSTWKFTADGSSIIGSVFNDVNGDSIREAGEAGSANWAVNLSGKIQKTVYTNMNGLYSFGLLDSGRYTVTEQLPKLWKRTFPSVASYVLTVGANDSINSIDFGNEYSGSSIRGLVFNDSNGNGIHESGEPGLSNWRVDINGKTQASVNTDSNGMYSFGLLDSGTYIITEELQTDWRKTFPSSASYVLTIGLKDTVGQIDFGNQIFGSSIGGSLFNDINGDSIHEVNEPALINWRIDLSGKKQESVFTNSNGVYLFSRLDSGTYIVTQQLQAVWRRTFPTFASYVLTIGLKDSIRHIDFGDLFPWNSIEGIAYVDINQNGTKDGFEPGMSNLEVTLYGPDSEVVVHTDSIGHFTFKHVSPGTNTVVLTTQPPFEQETPRYQQGYSYDIQTYGDQYIGFDFGVHKIPVRVKIPLTIYDNTLVNRRDIWFGIRPGASDGIWGVDPKATTIDFSEGEFEIPPPTLGLFDARFQDPHGGTAHFGAGSWTDMRDFSYFTHRDTFLVTFAPGYYYNGNYPMTIQWSLSDIRSAFPTVDPILIDAKGNRVDMSTGTGDTAHVTITDSTISYLYITTQDPHINFSRQWNMVSLPQNILDDYVGNIFTTASLNAFAYAPGTGYIIQDTLLTGKGYWIYYSPAIDSLFSNPLARLHDSVKIQPGWNMIGTLSLPVDVNGITTIPSGSISSKFFSYNKGYSWADTLLPTKGYWIKASQAAEMYLNASGSVTIPKSELKNDILGTSNIFLFRDNAGNAEQLYCRTAQAGDKNNNVSLYEAPPFPPEGSFDVRFSSNRILETIGEKQTGKFPIMIQGAEFPVTVSWQPNTNLLKTSIIIDGKETSLNGKTSIRIANPSSIVSLKLSGMPAIPSAFSLQQNYPNPFNPSTKVSYAVPKTSQVAIKVYDVLGREIVTLLNEKKDPGEYSLTWSAANIPSGIYFYRMTAGDFVQTRKMVVLK